MKDSKDMWAVTRDLTVNKVNVLYDTDSNQVTHYSFIESDVWYAMTDDFVKVFESEEGAKNYRIEHVGFLKGQQQYIYSLLQEMLFIQRENGTEEYQFELLNQLGDIHEMTEHDFWQKRYDELKNEQNRIVQAFKTGYINVEAYSFKTQDVVKIRWCMKGDTGDKYLKLILKDGDIIEVNKKNDMNIINTFFGDNYSGQVYVSKPKVTK